MKDENTFAPLPEHARKVMDAAQAKIAKLESLPTAKGCAMFPDTKDGTCSGDPSWECCNTCRRRVGVTVAPDPMRLCLDCLNCTYINAMPNYSEWTPGHGVEFRCNKGKWEFDAFETRRETFKSFLETARDCSDFEEL